MPRGFVQYPAFEREFEAYMHPAIWSPPEIIRLGAIILDLADLPE